MLAKYKEMEQETMFFIAKRQSMVLFSSKFTKLELRYSATILD